MNRKIHINPNFLVSNQSNIHVNPTFVNTHNKNIQETCEISSCLFNNTNKKLDNVVLPPVKQNKMGGNVNKDVKKFKPVMQKSSDNEKQRQSTPKQNYKNLLNSKTFYSDDYLKIFENGKLQSKMKSKSCYNVSNSVNKYVKKNEHASIVPKVDKVYSSKYSLDKRKLNCTDSKIVKSDFIQTKDNLKKITSTISSKQETNSPSRNMHNSNFSVFKMPPINLKSKIQPNIQNYIVKSGTKIVKSPQNCKESTCSHMEKGTLKSNYAVKTKTKLIRRNSKDFVKKKITSPGIKVSPLMKRHLLSKVKNNIFRSSPNSKMTFKPWHKYKVINKCYINPVKSLYANYQNERQSSKLHSPNIQRRLRRNSNNSDKFINIGGTLYKSTSTSLRKQVAKSRKSLENVTNKTKKQSPQQSRFVFRRQKSSELRNGTLIEIVRRKKLFGLGKVNDYCFFYIKYGRCKQQNKGCPFIHDPNRINICTRFLRGECLQPNCPFTHTTDKGRMPVCRHFLQGLCHKEECAYRHVNVNPDAPLCIDFVKGHCPLGEECKAKHILICEEFKASGLCPKGKKCPLSHRRTQTSDVKGEVLAPKKKRKSVTKVGVLGMALVEEKTSNRNNAPSSTSSGNRYFDQTEPIGEGTFEMPSDDTPTIPTFETRRLRVLSKVEKMKSIYEIASSSPTTIASSVDVATRSAGDVEQPLFPPLPDVLPDFISIN